jgi:hypothetical protein
MYSMLLTCFMLALLFLCRTQSGGRWGSWIGLVVATATTLMLHEMGVIIFLFWFLFWLVRREELVRPWGLLAVAIGLFVFWYLYQDFSAVRAPAGAVITAHREPSGSVLSGLLRTLYLGFVPKFTLLRHSLANTPLFLGAIGIAVALTLWPTLRSTRRTAGTGWSRIGLTLWALLGVLGLYGVMFVAAASAALLRCGELRDWLRKRASLVSLALIQAAVLFGLWLIYGLFVWQGGAQTDLEGLALLKRVVKDLIYYPALHFLVYLEAFPLLSGLVCAGTAYRVLAARPVGVGLKTALIWFWLPLFALGFTREWVALRYTLAVYPYFLMICALTLTDTSAAIARRLTAAQADGKPRLATRLATALPLVALLAWPSFDQHGLRAALSWCRLDYGQQVAASIHGFPFHPDHQGVGRYVKTQRLVADVVVAMDVQQMAYHLGAVDYWLTAPSNASRFSYHDGSERRDIYTGSLILDSLPALRRVVSQREGQRVWVVTSAELTGSLEHLVPPGVEEQLTHWEEHLVYVARDGQSRVFLFE